MTYLAGPFPATVSAAVAGNRREGNPKPFYVQINQKSNRFIPDLFIGYSILSKLSPTKEVNIIPHIQNSDPYLIDVKEPCRICLCLFCYCSFLMCYLDAICGEPIQELVQQILLTLCGG